MHHPWRQLRELPHWSVHFTTELPDTVRGVTRWSDRTIWVASHLGQAERRCTIEHEWQHILRGPGGLRRVEEREVRAATARRLIPLDQLVHALRWSQDEHELADELWVEVRVVRDRLRGLTEQEQNMIEEALDADG